MRQTRPARQKCCREGCRRNVKTTGRTSFSEYQACSFLCAQVAKELDRAKRVCEATQHTEHWQAAVSLNDALSAYLHSDTRIFRAAQKVGYTPQQWHAIKDGTATA